MKNFKPHIGKNVIETLTLGMYEDARFIYREYVQNAADQIDIAVEEGILKSRDTGEINIQIDSERRLITIKDNATGIKDDNVLQFLGDVANSQKDPEKRKGFRGIGRLGGLGYCEKLIFETSYYGENEKNTITLNAKQLKKIIENKADTSDAATVMSIITKLKPEQTESQEHYFKVTMENVTNDILLDISSVSEYLSMVAPIPFNPAFPYQTEIHNHYKANKVAIDEYDVHLNINETKLYKPYKTQFHQKNGEKVSLLNIACFSVENDQNEIIGIGWYGITNLLNFQIPDENIEGGIRLRKENIGIGDRLTLSKFFGQPRQNQNYIGEVHAIGSGFIPNARRDNFNDSATYSCLEDELKKIFSSLGSYTQDSSKLHNRKEDINIYRKKSADFDIESRSGDKTERELKELEEELKKLKNQALYSASEIKKIKNKSTSDENLSVVYNSIIGDYDVTIGDEEIDLSLNAQSFPLTLSKLSSKEKELVTEIFSIIEENLTLEKAEMLKKKIAERYN